MKTKHLLFTSILMLVFSIGVTYGQWSVYTCDVTPNLYPDSVFLKASTTPDVSDGPEAALCTVVDDPDISGNKLIMIEDLTGDKRESWKAETAGGGFSDPSIGATVVWRAKPNEGILGIAAEDGNDYQYYYMSLRNGGFQEEIIWIYPGKIVADRMGLEFLIPGTDWHIFRATIKNDAVNIYMDEDPFPIITGITAKTTSNTMLRFGDNNTAQFQGCYTDWIVWDTTGAYAPGEGTALPAELTGLPGGGTSIADLSTSENLSAFPNPFTGSTTISYRVETTSITRINIYDLTGKLVRNLYNDVQVAGNHEIQFNAEGMPAGMYYCHARSGNSVSVVKILLR